MGVDSESVVKSQKVDSPTLTSLKGKDLGQFRERQDYKSRLSEYLTGYPIEDGAVLLGKMIEDKQAFHLELGFPPVEERVDNPSLYKSEILARAEKEGIKIISFKEVPDWVLEKDPWIKKTRDNGSATAGCYCEDLDSIIIGDPSSDDPNVLKVEAHELVHAIDYKKMKSEGAQTRSIEELEYRAYLLADVSERRMKSEDGVKVLGAIFGDFGIAGSSFGYYLSKSIESGECKDYGEFMKKANSGKIKIPWFGAR